MNVNGLGPAARTAAAPVRNETPAPADAQVQTSTAAPVELVGAVESAQETEPEDSTAEQDVERLPVLVQTMGELMRSVNSRLTMRLHEESGRVQARIVDVETQEVLKEIPPDRILDLVGRIRAAIGTFLDTKV